LFKNTNDVLKDRPERQASLLDLVDSLFVCVKDGKYMHAEEYLVRLQENPYILH
jgi:hypothetical protein